MCLDKVDKETKKDVRYAYKVFDTLYGKRYYSLTYKGALWRTLKRISFELYWFLYIRFERTYDLGRMYTSSKRRIKAGDGTRYRSGFHCFVNETDAKAYRDLFFGPDQPIVKVAIDDIVASGEQDGLDGLDVIVARKMRLIEECQTNT